jgi:hypothetical protein
MFDDDSAARRALQTLTDEPAPPVTTTLDQVLRRGRRRVFVRRTGTVAAAVLMVATIGVGAVLLRPGAPRDDVQVATSTVAPPPTVDGPLPGWAYVGPPDGQCEHGPGTSLPEAPKIPLLPVEVVEKAFTNAIERVTGDVPTTVGRYWLENSPKHDAPAGYLTSEVPMSNGNGQLQLEAYSYGGTPTEMADASIDAYGLCTRPARQVLDDGTILQLYTVNVITPEQPTQPLQIYRPDGREYIVTAAGYSEADRVQLDGGASTFEGGRGALPTTESQLADLALTLVTGLD